MKFFILIFIIMISNFGGSQSSSNFYLYFGYDFLAGKNYDDNSYASYGESFGYGPHFYEAQEQDYSFNFKNYLNLTLGWNYDRLFLNMSFYTFKDVFKINARKYVPHHNTSSPMLFSTSNLNYEEKRVFFGGSLNVGMNVLPINLNSELIISVGTYFDKNISYSVEEDYVFKQNNYNHITDESSSTEESDIESEGFDIYRGTRFRTFLNVTYNYHFFDNWVASFNVGFNPNTKVTRHYFNRDKELLLHYRYDLFVGLKLGYTFPMKEK